MAEENKGKHLGAALEALLYMYGEPLEVKRIAKLLTVEETVIEEVIKEMERSYGEEARGLYLLAQGGKIQLATKPEFGNILAEILKAELHAELTPAALETLAIIAYAGPMLRSAIDYVRGVNSSFILRSLLLRGLIERSLDVERGNAFRYAVSFDFLKHVGVRKAKELPEYERFRKLVSEFHLEG